MSTILKYTKKRLLAFCRVLEHLEIIDFPYPDSEQALREIGDTFRIYLQELEKLSSQSDPATVHAACGSALSALTLYLPHVGFIVRSTDVRNPFEICGPLRRLCWHFLGEDTKLILSSEWEYSPYTYVGIPILSRFVMIGLPASESENPLLVPLAGHELGHSVWRHRSLDRQFSPMIEEAIVSEIQDERWADYQQHFPNFRKSDLSSAISAKQTWEYAHACALRQLEETFCDFFGLRIFGEAYLHSLAYLLAPNLGGYRSFDYPNMVDRVTNLKTAAVEFDIKVPPSYEDLFENLREPPAEAIAQFLKELADAALDRLVGDLVDAVNVVFQSMPMKKDDPRVIDSILKSFVDHMIPAKSPATLSEILNAAWRASLVEDLWEDRCGTRSRDEILRDLVLKSIEVLEFYEIMEQNDS